MPREVERAVAGPGVHVAHELEDAREPAVLELDGRVVLGRGVALEEDDVGVLLQQRVDLAGTLRLGPAFHDDQRAVGGLPGRGFDLHALQPLLERGHMGGDQVGGCGSAGEAGIQRIKFRALGGGESFGLADVHLRRFHLLCVEIDLLAGGGHDDEPHGGVGAGDLRKGILLRPLGRRLVVGVALGEEVAQYDALLGELLRACRVEVAPGAQFVGRFLQTGDLGLGRSGLALGAEVSGERLGPRSVGLRLRLLMLGLVGPRLEEVDGLVARLDVQQQLPVLLRGLPTGDGDVDQPQFAQAVDEIGALCREEHKVVFRHSCYHNVAPSPACCCLVFTIFCADLERFSSSSMKRLILRMASS